MQANRADATMAHGTKEWWLLLEPEPEPGQAAKSAEPEQLGSTPSPIIDARPRMSMIGAEWLRSADDADDAFEFKFEFMCCVEGSSETCTARVP